MTLVEFLRARLDEDEELANDTTRWPWDYYADGKVLGVGQNRVAKGVPSWNGPHIARHDPARVLAEVEAKRRIVDVHDRAVEDVQGLPFCSECGSPDDWTVSKLPPEYAWPCDTLRLLASPYAGHPDYCPEWKP